MSRNVTNRFGDRVAVRVAGRVAGLVAGRVAGHVDGQVATNRINKSGVENEYRNFAT